MIEKGLPGEESVKRFERSNGLDTALYKTIPFTFLFISGDEMQDRASRRRLVRNIDLI